MSTVQQNQSNGFSPIRLSPSSTSNTTITNNHIVLFDNSDQGSVDSDYTSLGSSKFYGNGGSTSSLHRQGRSQSIDELASTTTIPTRHFNGTLNVNKFNNDPLQFVKVHPNHDLIERAQEQLTLLESRKRLQENFKLNNNQNINHTNTNKINDDDNTDWSKAVENWRQKREQKRRQSTNRTEDDDDPPMSIPNNDRIPSSPIKKFDEFKTKPTLPPPPPPPPTVVPSMQLPSTNKSIGQLIPDRTKSKSPSPQRIKGPARIHEIFIQIPVGVRGFGFRIDGGSALKRAIFIAALEDGSPADKAGLCLDDEVISMNDQNIEDMTFEQVRKILKERNLRGSIKMVVKTYEDLIDDNSQTVTTGPTTEHSRTPSPQKPLSNFHSTTPAHSIPTTSSTIHQTNSTPSSVQNVLSPVYTFVPYTPPPSSSSIPPSDTTTNVPVRRTPPPPPLSTTPSSFLTGPKPFRSSNSIILAAQNHNETNITHSSPIEAFRKMLDPSNSISKSMKNETAGTIEQQSSKSTTRDAVNTFLSNPTLVSSTIINPSSSMVTNSKPPPPPLTSIESLLHGPPDINSNNQQRNESPMTQVRTSVEKQMNQLQQELLGFPHKPSSSDDIKREQRPVNIPVDLTHAALPSNSPIIKSSSSIPLSNHQQDSNNNRTYGLQVNPNDHAIHYLQPYSQPRPSSSFTIRSAQDLPSTTTPTNRAASAHSSDRTVNELRVNLSSPQQKKVSIQLDEKMPQQHITSKQLHTTLNQAPKQSHYEDHSWITDDQRKPMTAPPPPPPSSQSSSHNNGRSGSARRSVSLAPPHHQDLQMNRQAPNQLTMFHYGDHPDKYQHSRSTQLQRDYNSSINEYHQSKQRTRSPIRTTINSNNNRVLSVSGKLRCSRCNDELGQGSAMVIESLGLYYHIECFRCFVCNIPLSSSFEGTDVRVRNNRLHCQNCFSDENGAWKSNV